MCAYSFPEHIPLSDNVKNLISKILQLDATKRPSLDDIMRHPFLNNGAGIPRFLPLSTLACPPSKNYLNQFSANNRKEDAANNDGFKTGESNLRRNDVAAGNNNPRVANADSGDALKKQAADAGAGKQDVYVKKWVDYSSKYGLGYLLSNGSSGVFFNDCTKIILDPKKE